MRGVRTTRVEICAEVKGLPLGDTGDQMKKKDLLLIMKKQEENSKPRWLTANSQFYKEYKYERNRLKDNLTTAEEILWEHLRNKKLGVKFRRQHVIEHYIPDFVVLSIKLIIEVDGKIHLKHKIKDEERTQLFELIGYKVIRFKNEEVENDIEEVLKKIKIEISILTSPNLSKGEG